MYRTARRIVIFVIGTTVLLFGLALLVLPGPAFIVIPAGLAILATEFAWAKRFLNRAKRGVLNMTGLKRNQPVEPPSAEDRGPHSGQ